MPTAWETVELRNFGFRQQQTSKERSEFSLAPRVERVTRSFWAASRARGNTAGNTGERPLAPLAEAPRARDRLLPPHRRLLQRSVEGKRRGLSAPYQLRLGAAADPPVLKVVYGRIEGLHWGPTSAKLNL